MKVIYYLCLILMLITLCVMPVYASSQSAFQDYQFQFDLYRQRLSEYQIAMTRNKQLNSLISQQEALDKAKLYIAQRDTVSKTYFLFLNEKLSEIPGLQSNELVIYRAIITNQVGFLDQNAVLVPSSASLDDVAKVSEKYTSNYETMQSAYRQTIAVIELGYLNYFAKKFDDTAVHAQALIAAAKPGLAAEKQTLLDRWLLALSNKHSLYQQKSNDIRSAIPKITGDAQLQDRLFLQLQTKFNDARQDLIEAGSYLKEIERALKYD